MKKSSIYSYIDRQGREVSLRPEMDPKGRGLQSVDPAVKEKYSMLAMRLDRVHRLASAMDSLRSAGVGPDELREMVSYILAGRSLRKLAD